MKGEGGLLDNVIHNVKRQLWSRLPSSAKKMVIIRKSSSVKNTIDKLQNDAKKVCIYNEKISKKFEPDYTSRTPVVDYRRQYFRGTLVEGRDAYLPNVIDQQRTSNIFEPYTEEETKSRKKYERYNLRYALAIFLGGSFLYDYKRSRPIAWCNVFIPSCPRQPWHWRHFKHAHDVKSVRRGFEVYRQICSSCHSLKKCKWWFLMKDVYPVRRVQEFAAETTTIDGLTDDGEVNARPGMTWDYFPNPFPTDEAAKEANGGKVPPDFSCGPYIYTGGADYFFALLTGYREPPVGVKLLEGTFYNPWFAGSVISMPPPLEDGLVDYEDGTPSTVSQMAKDVTNFLVFVAAPQHDEKKMWLLKVAIASFLSIFPLFYVHRQAFTGVLTRRVDFGTKVRYL